MISFVPVCIDMAPIRLVTIVCVLVFFRWVRDSRPTTIKAESHVGNRKTHTDCVCFCFRLIFQLNGVDNGQFHQGRTSSFHSTDLCKSHKYARHFHSTHTHHHRRLLDSVIPLNDRNSHISIEYGNYIWSSWAGYQTKCLNHLYSTIA